MIKTISKTQKFMMNCVLVQLFIFTYLNIKILFVVGKGHGGTR